VQHSEVEPDSISTNDTSVPVPSPVFGSRMLARTGAYFAHRNGIAAHFRITTVRWTELLAQAAGSAERAQLVLDSALAAASAVGNAALDAEITAVLPTALELCAVLDAFGVRVPGEVAARVSWYSRPEQGRAMPRPVPQDLHAGKPAFQ
jgi:hypothetical protein